MVQSLIGGPNEVHLSNFTTEELCPLTLSIIVCYAQGLTFMYPNSVGVKRAAWFSGFVQIVLV